MAFYGLKNQAKGVAGLDNTTKLLVAQIPNAIPATTVADGSVTNSSFQFLAGATSNIQDQINALSSLKTPTTISTSSTLSNTAYNNISLVTATALTVTLPATPVTGATYTIKLQNVATCTIAPTGAVAKIDGEDTLTLANYDSANLYYDGAQYNLL